MSCHCIRVLRHGVTSLGHARYHFYISAFQSLCYVLWRHCVMSVLKVDVLRHRITLLRCVIVLCRCFCSQCAVHCMSLCTVMSVCYVSVLCHRVTYDIIMSLCYLIVLCRLFSVLCRCFSMCYAPYYVSETGYHYVVVCRAWSVSMLYTVCQCTMSARLDIIMS